MNPTDLSNAISTSLVNYMKDRRPIQKALGDDDDFAKELTAELHAYPFIKDTYVERLPRYRKDAASTLGGLLQDHAIEEETAELFARVFHADSPENARLYSHQGKAIRAVSQGRKNLIVCTGTGSGKTESFLIPVLNAIISERKKGQGTYRKGVRALILYPMNALVNDQVRRLREILRYAQSGTPIPYAKDITFGCYTSELEKSAHAPLCDISDAPFMELADVRHTRHSADAKLGTEYVSRPQWTNPADILITNYAMLERLLIDPDKSNMFSNTWKFIVLDEAHSYDGSLGTDISWLVRRLVCRTEAKGMQFIATSATLTDKTGDEAVKSIQDSFASRIFPADPPSFDVELGDYEQDDWNTPAEAEGEGHYSTLADHTGVELPRHLSEAMQTLPEAIRPRATGQTHNLLQLTQWQNEAQVWIDQFSELRFATATKQGLGDALAQAHLYAKVDPEGSLQLDPSAGAYGHVKQCLASAGKKHKPLSRYIPSGRVTQGTSADKHARTLKSLKEIPSWQYDCMGQALSDRFAGQDTNPMLLEVAWDATSSAKLLDLKKSIDAGSLILQEVRDVLKAKWAEIAGTPSHATIMQSATRYLETRPHIARLAGALKTCNGRLGQVLPLLFAGNAVEDPSKEFHALARLLTLTGRDGRPLMDLRFHLLFKTISNFSVYFDDELKPHPVADDGDAQDYNGRPLYTLGCCPVCGQPYLLGYFRGRDMAAEGGRVRFSKFKPATGNAYRQAFALVKRTGNGIDWPEPREARHPWLDPRSGEIHFGPKAPEPGKWVDLFWYVSPEGADQPLHLNSCPACGTKAPARNTGDDGLLIPFRAGEARAKTIVLNAIASAADPSPTARNKKAQGRKVLAFSDSRAQAALLASAFDGDTQRDLIEYAVCHALSEAEDMAKQDEEAFFNSSYQYCKDNGFFNEAYQDRKSNRRATYEECRQNWDEDGYRNPDCHSLPALLWLMAETFRHAGASHLLAGSFPPANGSAQEASEADNVALAALSVLRKKGRNALPQSGAVDVYSYTAERIIQGTESSDLWDDYCEMCQEADPRIQPDVFFRKVYKYLFKNANVDCSRFNIRTGAHYIGTEGIQPVNGCDPYERKNITQNQDTTIIFSVSRNNPFCRLLKKTAGRMLPDSAMASVLETLWDFLTEAGVLVRRPNTTSVYALDLDDVRYRLVEAPASISAKDPIHFRIEEHTAQLTSSKGSEYQRLFAEGDINILSCSTTFEMGVDLGSLNCVFIGNMPPGVANYQQRAGRAGRRAGSTSCVITFIGNSSHDRYHANHPETLFFGKSRQPSIYSANPTFLAKHMRAEALYDFLRYVREVDEDAFKKWNTSGDFFGCRQVEDGEEAGRPAVSYLTDWYDRRAEEVQKYCRRIAEVDYLVAADLCYQVIGTEKPHGMRGITKAAYDKALNVAPDRKLSRYLELDGPNMPAGRTRDADRAPLVIHYKLRHDEMGSGGARYRLLEGQTLEEFSQNRILPKFGFPCDVITLSTDEDDAERKDVEMSRERRLAIYEYAPGQKVYANKRIYTSVRALRFTRRGDYMEYFDRNPERTFVLCPCGYIATLHPDEAVSANCPFCNAALGDKHKRKALRPDGFRASASREAKYATSSWNRTPQRYNAYCGGKEASFMVTGTRLRTSQSDNRELIYFNDTKRKHDAEYEGLFHSARTDMVIWDCASEPADCGWDDAQRYHHAWQSAAQAIQKAISLVLDISPRDIGVLLTGAWSSPFIVIYDDSPSGSGVVLKLLKSSPADKEADALSREVLRKALELVEACDCHRASDGTTPVTHEQYTATPLDQREGLREYTACYHCIKSYSNQRMHPWLDAHDAAVVLRHLLGDAEGGADTPVETRAAAAPEKAVPAPQVEVQAPVISARRLQRGEELQRMRSGSFPKTETITLCVDGVEVEATYVRCYESHVRIRLENGGTRNISFEEYLNC